MTLKELSVKIGVSPSIISRVLNNYSQNFSISDELREKILLKVKEYNYHPNPVFAATRQKKSRQISILFYSPSPKSVGITMDEMVDAANLNLIQRGYMVNFLFSSAPRETLIYQLPPWKVGGLLIPDCQTARNVEMIEAANIPYVCMNGVSGARGTAVQCDEEDGMRQILMYLYQMGHRNIVLWQFPTPPIQCYSPDYIRREAFLRICAEMKIQSHCIEDADMEPHQADLNRAKVAALFDQKVSALICRSDICTQIYYYTSALGKKIPQDISVVAYNDEKQLQWFLPPVTTFKIPGHEIGNTAADILYRKITEDSKYCEGQTRFLKGELVLRHSVMDIN